MCVTATSIWEDATKALGGTATTSAFATIVTVGGVPVVEVTSVGGAAITLATGTQSGFTTSFVGHVFTAVPSPAPSSASSSASSSSASAS